MDASEVVKGEEERQEEAVLPSSLAVAEVEVPERRLSYKEEERSVSSEEDVTGAKDDVSEAFAPKVPMPPSGGAKAHDAEDVVPVTPLDEAPAETSGEPGTAAGRISETEAPMTSTAAENANADQPVSERQTLGEMPEAVPPVPAEKAPCETAAGGQTAGSVGASRRDNQSEADAAASAPQRRLRGASEQKIDQDGELPAEPFMPVREAERTDPAVQNAGEQVSSAETPERSLRQINSEEDGPTSPEAAHAPTGSGLDGQATEDGDNAEPADRAATVPNHVSGTEVSRGNTELDLVAEAQTAVAEPDQQARTFAPVA